MTGDRRPIYLSLYYPAIANPSEMGFASACAAPWATAAQSIRYCTPRDSPSRPRYFFGGRRKGSLSRILFFFSSSLASVFGAVFQR